MKYTSIVFLTITIPMHAMELELSKPTIKDLQHKRDVLVEMLKERPCSFWMPTPEDDGFHAIYQAQNSDVLSKVVYSCNPSTRIKGCSTLGIIIISPNIKISEKKKMIQHAYHLMFVSTPEDKELDIVQVWERYEKEKILHKICLLLWAHKDNETLFSQLPRELIDYIAAQLTFASELLL